MPRSKAPRKAYRPKPQFLNAVQIACNGARTLSPADVQAQLQRLQAALQALASGSEFLQPWNDWADAANMAEDLCRLRIGSGPEGEHVVASAQLALHDVATRHQQGCDWQLTAHEQDVLRWLHTLHGLQLQVCDYSEFNRAFQRAKNRLQQARAGNGPRGAVVVVGALS